MEPGGFYSNYATAQRDPASYAPYSTTSTSDGLNIPVSVVQKLDYLLTSFEDHKLRMSKDAEKMMNEISSVKSELDEIKHKIEENEKLMREKNFVKKTRNKVPSQLSLAVKQLHDSASGKFIASEAFSSEKNKKVQEYLLNHLKAKVQDTHSPRRLKLAIHRYYESRRRLFNDQKPCRVKKVEEVRRNTRKRHLRRKLYIDRQKALKKEKEQKLWSVLNYCYMTEESEFENDEGELEIHQHKLPWRSTKLNKLIKKLDKRIPKPKIPKPKKIVKEDSKQNPPVGAPTWAVADDIFLEEKVGYTPSSGSHNSLDAESMISSDLSHTPSFNPTHTPSSSSSCSHTSLSTYSIKPTYRAKRVLQTNASSKLNKSASTPTTHQTLYQPHQLLHSMVLNEDSELNSTSSDSETSEFSTDADSDHGIYDND